MWFRASQSTPMLGMGKGWGKRKKINAVETNSMEKIGESFLQFFFY
jgi:hypothetical protein